MDDDIVSLLPVDGGGDLVLVAQLQRVDDSEDLVKVPAGLGGVREGETDDLLGVDDEDGADGEGDPLGVYIGRVHGIEHVVEGRNGAIRVCDLERDMGRLGGKATRIRSPSKKAVRLTIGN